MKIVMEIIPIILLTIVSIFSINVLNPYLIVKGLIPREGNLVSIFGIAAYSLGLLGGWIIAINNKKRGNSKE
ncbi:hypothetical protein JCM17380_41740 [Desulfosporosinus burensis]